MHSEEGSSLNSNSGIFELWILIWSLFVFFKDHAPRVISPAHFSSFQLCGSPSSGGVKLIDITASALVMRIL
jgi:hypothetical protein